LGKIALIGGGGVKIQDVPITIQHIQGWPTLVGLEKQAEEKPPTFLSGEGRCYFIGGKKKTSARFTGLGKRVPKNPGFYRLGWGKVPGGIKGSLWSWGPRKIRITLERNARERKTV